MPDKTRYAVKVLDPNAEQDREVYTFAYSPEQAKRNVMTRESLADTDIISVSEDTGGAPDDGFGVADFGDGAL